MDSTNAQGLEQALQGGYHGQENSLMRKLNLFFHLASLMALNGSILVESFNLYTQFFFPFFLLIFEKNSLNLWWKIFYV